jgi:hypothetical protein
MKKLKLFFIGFSLLYFLIQGCEQDIHAPINNENEIPPKIENPQVFNLPGAAEIKYNIPRDKQGLLYVKAEYEILPGITREVKSSYYSNNLYLEGFGDTLQYNVNLYSVGRNGKISDPVNVVVNPLKPPIWEAYESISVKEDWGGIAFSFENPHEANVVFEVSVKDSLNEWAPLENFYTQRSSAVFAVRGLEPVEQTFGISVRDRWLNRTDTLVGAYTPWYEEFLDKSIWKKVDLPTDYTVNHGGSNFEQIFDNVYSGHGWISKPDTDGSRGGGMPQSFTLDLGATVLLSRLVVFYRRGDYLYQSGCPDEFEIWGSNNPNQDGSWDDSWTLLRECKTVKPSGLPHGQQTQEDDEYAAGGDEFIFENIPPVRYIRWKTLSNQAKSTHVNFVEMDLYGQVVE